MRRERARCWSAERLERGPARTAWSMRVDLSMHRTIVITIAAFALGSASLGCAGPSTPKQATGVRLPLADSDGRYHPPMDKEMPLPATRLIGADFGPPFDTCGEAQIRFAFDESIALPQVEQQLDDLATCLQAPQHAEMRIGLVGRADPRGTDPYNEKLAQKRGDYIKSRLVARGVAAGRIVVASKGESESVGAKPEYAFGYDRRVDVVYLRAILPANHSLPAGSPNLEKAYHPAPTP